MSIEIPRLYRTLVDSNKVPFITGQRDIINDAARQNTTLGLLLHGANMKQMISHSWALEDRVYLERLNRLKAYNPGRPSQFPNFQPGVNHRSHWSYYHVPHQWTAIELMQGAPKGAANAKELYSYLKDVRFQKDQDCYTAVIEDFDDLLWAKPNYDLMENLASAVNNDNGFPAFLSIPAWLNEEPNGLYDTPETGTFTSIQQIDPVRYPNWVPTQVPYDNDDASFADPANENRLIEAMVTAAHRIDFRAPSMYPEYWEKNPNLAQDFVCITGEAGRKRVDSSFAQNGDNFITMGKTEMSYGSRTVEGMIIREHIPLDDYALFRDGSGALVTQDQAANPGPRFYMLNKRYYKVMFFSQRFFARGEVQNVPGTDEAWVQDIKVWSQGWVNSRRRHAIVFPGDYSEE